MAKKLNSKSLKRKKNKIVNARMGAKSKKSTKKSSPKSRTAAPIKIAADTYNQWVSKQVGKKGRSAPAVSINTLSAMPKDTFNEWITRQHVVEKSVARREGATFSNTYDEWIARQIAEREDGGAIVKTSAALLQKMNAPSKIMPAPSSEPLVVPDFAPLLSKSNVIELTFTGRKSGKNYSTPVWFVYDENEDSLSLLPVGGSKSKWFKNLQANSSLKLSIAGTSKTFEETDVKVDPVKAGEIAEKFRAKYGADEVKGYYPEPDAFVLVKVS